MSAWHKARRFINAYDHDAGRWRDTVAGELEQALQDAVIAAVNRQRLPVRPIDVARVVGSAADILRAVEAEVKAYGVRGGSLSQHAGSPDFASFTATLLMMKFGFWLSPAGVLHAAANARILPGSVAHPLHRPTASVRRHDPAEVYPPLLITTSDTEELFLLRPGGDLVNLMRFARDDVMDMGARRALADAIEEEERLPIDYRERESERHRDAAVIIGNVAITDRLAAAERRAK